MPWFKVQIQCGGLFIPRTKHILSIEASSLPRALKKAKEQGYVVGGSPDPKRDEREAAKEHWRQIWRRAFDNMPAKVIHTAEWKDGIKGVSVPDFILLRAKGKARIDDYGTVTILVDEYTLFGQREALAFCLGHFGRFAGQHISSSMNRGSRPTSLTERRQLARLASSEGPELAWRLLNERRPCGYTVCPYPNPGGKR